MNNLMNEYPQEKNATTAAQEMTTTEINIYCLGLSGK